VTAIRAAGCCCQKGNVGIFCPDDVLFKQGAVSPGLQGHSIENIYKFIYDNKNKGKVVRIDSEKTLMDCNVAFFGVLTGANSTASATSPKVVFSPATGASATGSTSNGLIRYTNPWWSSPSMSEALSKFVAKGGRLVLLGDGPGVNATPAFRAGAVSECNSILVAANNNNNASSCVQFVNPPACTNCFGECFCTSPKCAKGTALRQVLPNTPFSYYPNNGIWTDPEGSGTYLAFFFPGSSNEFQLLTGGVSYFSSNSCGGGSVGTYYPAAYSQLSGGYHIVISDVNCVLTSPVSIGIFSQLDPNDGGCPGTNQVDATINAACNPNGMFTGLNFLDINLPFLWTLAQPCTTC
jgi:hypothetical protein